MAELPERTCPGCGQRLKAEEAFCPFCPGECAKPVDAGVGIDRVSAFGGSRLLAGPLVLAGDGLFLFVDTVEQAPDLGRSLWYGLVDRLTGFIGGKTLKAVERFVEGTGRLPAYLQPREDYGFYYDRHLKRLPGIVSCPWCLPLTRDTVRSAVFHGPNMLVVEAGGMRFEIMGPLGAAGAAEYLKRRGYPVRKSPLGSLHHWRWRAVGALAALLSLGMVLGEAFELKAAGEWLFPKAAAVYLAFSTNPKDPVRVFLRDGKRFFIIDGKEIAERDVPPEIRRLYKWRGTSEFFSVVAIILPLGVFFVWLLRKAAG